MLEAEKIAATEAAKKLRANIIWSKYPKLAEIFQNRPPVNALWIEFAELIRELRSS